MLFREREYISNRKYIFGPYIKFRHLLGNDWRAMSNNGRTIRIYISFKVLFKLLFTLWPFYLKLNECVFSS